MNDTTEVKLHFLDYWRTIKLRMGLILLTFFLVMVTAGVTTYFLPRQYYSKVTMEVKPDKSDSLGPIFGSGARAGASAGGTRPRTGAAPRRADGGSRRRRGR